MEKTQTLHDFYQLHPQLRPATLPAETGQFNVFHLQQVLEAGTKCSSFGRKQFYKISLLPGRSTYHYADKSVYIEQNGLIFSNPQVPYHWDFHGENQAGVFCVFTEAFVPRLAGLPLPETPLFRPGGQAVFQLTDEQFATMRGVFTKMFAELAADYPFKYDVLRNATLDLLHGALRLQPAAVAPPYANAAARITALFLELLELQFPIESPEQRVRLRFPVEFAAQLAVHVNHLNKALKDTTGQTTSGLLAARLTQEARILLRQTRWTVSEIGRCLGFEELPHFINFFRKNAGVTPNAFRQSSLIFAAF